VTPTLRHLSVERAGGLARVTLNRPPANALNLELIDELALVAKMLSDDDTRVVLLGSALPIFMAGADLVHMVDRRVGRRAQHDRALPIGCQ
jgi:enoyl-CoA hydratase/carnithine racemase